MRWRATWTCLGLAALVVGNATCAVLDSIDGGRCGNGVLEPANKEDCDPGQGDYAIHNCGAVGTEQECRWACSDTVPCPTDQAWKCGEDGICRLPSGAFERRADIATVGGAQDLATGDFDDDGRLDLVTASFGGYEAHFFDGAGAVEHSASIAGGGEEVVTTPVVGDFSGDGLDDVAVLRGKALFVGRGQVDRTIAPTSFSPFELPATDARAAIVDALPEYFDDAEQAYRQRGPEVVLLLDPGTADVAVECETCASESVWQLPGITLDELSVATGRFEVFEDLPCDAFVFAEQGASSVYVVPACTGQGVLWSWNERAAGVWTFSTPAVEISLPPGAAVGTRWTFGAPGTLRLADANLDGMLDVLIESDFAAQCERADGRTAISSSFVAYGTADGFRGLTAADTNEAVLFCPPLPLEAQGLWLALPVAAGELNDDGRTDFLFGDATGSFLLLSTGGSAPPTPAEGNVEDNEYRVDYFNADWTAAWAADFNVDGIIDFLTATEGDPALRFYQGAGLGAFNEFQVGLSAPLRGVAVGDFDGDRLLDAALIEGESIEGDGTSNETRAALSVSFGAPFGELAAPVTMASAAAIEWLVVGAIQSSGHFDAVDDILMGARAGADAPLTLGLLEGSSDRRLFSPFSFGDDAANAETPVSLIAGQLDPAGDGRIDLAAVAAATPGETVCTDGPAAGSTWERTWLLRMGPDATLDPAFIAKIDLLATGGSDSLPERLAWPYGVTTSVDLDGNGIDELLTFAPRIAASGFVGTAISVLASDPETSAWPTEAPAVRTIDGIVIGRSSGERDPCARFAQQEPAPPEPPPGRGSDRDEGQSTSLSLRSQVKVADVDGDGDEDVVALGFDTRDAGGLTLAATPVVLLFLSDGSGTFDEHARFELRGLDEPAMTDFAFLQADADPQLEIALATSDAVFVADLVWSGGSTPMTVAFGPATLLDPNAQGQRGAEVIAAGDLTGDGVDDLALARGGKIELYAGRPTLR